MLCCGLRTRGTQREALPTGPAPKGKLEIPGNGALDIHVNGLFHYGLLVRINHFFSMDITYILSKKVLAF